ncbi:DUF7133 domain-containing protein [Rubinisphaera margarita]|uniref:DUF7133 domain-containing protein n=1 Tax=Rubinisphaera margarita TaxID=2909586 RepID=UPI001EE98728|nr:c-type cytochrome [Rubinisphaera margarita]MCG6155435.1 c-type cytochrome [Rubinisphaera margarita]
MRRVLTDFFSTLLPLLAVMASPGLLAAQQVPLKVPSGFAAQLYATHELAGDIQCMTTDSQGRIVVSGPGYIKTLIDADHDGTAESAELFADGPKTGAQGLCFDGNTLYCIGDEGLIAYRDEDADGKADGAPELIYRCRTGGEHFTHAIRKGPDGWIYMIAGNEAGIDESVISLEHSPILKPEAGLLLRFSPNFGEIQVLCDGLRNAYDFDFNTSGELFTYDSDGERDISLPWYRPTRVFNSVPGMTHGWVSRSWKKPNYFHEMSPVMAETGRGSPTGVVCYAHQQFPVEFQNTVFVLDWTYGRVIAVKIQRQGASWAAQSREFATGIGTYGFAPTDAVVGPDGDLFISVGGRGTQGTVFRISHSSGAPKQNPKATQLDQILNAPQPLAAWSRARWQPAAKSLGEEPILRAALDRNRTAAERIRAVEILTELFQGPDIDFMKSMVLEKDRELRARGVWAYGRVVEGRPDPQALQPFLVDSSPAVVRSALEALLTCPSNALTGFENEIAGCLGHEDHVVRYLALRVAARMTDAGFRAVGDIARTAGWPEAMLMAWAFVDRGYPGHPYGWHDIGTAALTRQKDPELQLTAVLLIQHALGGFGSSPAHPAVFDGYLPRTPLDQDAEQLQTLQQAIEEMYPSGDALVDWELARLTAMISPDSPALLEKLLTRITADSDPVSDLHHLIVLATLPSTRSEEQTGRTATALLQLHDKLEARKAVLDRNWDPRVRELYDALVTRDANLPKTIAEHEKFGRPEHNLFVDAMTGEARDTAIAAYFDAVQADRIDLSPDLLQRFQELDDPAVLQMAREALEDDSLRKQAVAVLAGSNESEDRETIRSGLKFEEFDIVSSCLQAISAWEEFQPEDLAAVVDLLVRLARRDGVDAVWAEALQLTEPIARQLAEEHPPVPEATFPVSSIDLTHQEIAAEWQGWLAVSFPEALTFNTPADRSLQTDWHERLRQIDWDEGDADNGRLLFEQKQCAQCHGTRNAMGPDLAGAADRFSLDDLFEAIVNPHKDVSARYRGTILSTEEGKTYSGIVIYEAVDGLLLRDGSHRTIRIESDEIAFRKPLETSIMPADLLKDLNDGDLADLYAYLKQLGH